MIIEKYYKKQSCKRITDPFAKLDFLFEFPYLKCYVPISIQCTVHHRLKFNGAIIGQTWHNYSVPIIFS